MKRRARFLAGILAGCMIFGQTVFAEEQTPAETTEAVAKETEEQVKDNRQSEEAATQESDMKESSVKAAEEMPAAESTDAQPFEVEKTVYVGIPIRMEQICDEIPWYYTAESSDSSICEVSDIRERQDYSGNGYSRFNLTGKKPGSVDITFTDEYDYSVKFIYHVEVKEAPSDAVPFWDAVLNGKLLADGRYDQNNDEYISVDEMKGQEYFNLSPFSGAYYEEEFITDLSGMEYAENADTIYLAGNETLESIDALSGLKNLGSISLDNTAVPDAAKWELAGFTDVECEKGDKVSVPKIRGLFGNNYTDVKLEVLDNPEDNIISEIQGGNYEYPYFYAFNSGTARLRVSWKEFSEEFTVNVTGIDSDQAMDTEYGVPIQFSTLKEDDQSYTYALKENGELWQIFPEMKVVGQNVKEVAYSYVLTEDGKVYNIMDMDNVVMDNVKDISSNSALKEDGTAWEISEDGTWSKVADDVKQISGTSFYLKNNGELYSWSENTLFHENVEYIVNDGYYITGKGFYQRALGAFMGNIRAVKAAYRFNRMVDGKYTTYDLLVTESGEVWATNTSVYSGIVESVVNLGSDFAGFSNNKGDWSEGGCQWDWYDTKGNYYKWDQVVTPSESTPIELNNGIAGLDDYTLMKKGDNQDNYLYRNGAEMLDGVKDIIIMNFEKAFALRNDGSIWDVTGTPVKIGTLNTGDDYIRGDITGDGSVQIDDLRMILRSVCGKVELTEQQKLAADVEADGEVNISDLRKVLRFVCGKIEEL